MGSEAVYLGVEFVGRNRHRLYFYIDTLSGRQGLSLRLDLIVGDDNGEPIFLPFLNGIGMGHRQLKIKQRGGVMARFGEGGQAP